MAKKSKTPTIAAIKPSTLLSPSFHELLARRQCVAYVGAGFSMGCGMPDWKGLLFRLLEKAWATLDGGVGNDDRRHQIESCARAINAAEFQRAAHLLTKGVLSDADVNKTVQEMFDNDVLHRASARQQEQMKGRMSHLAQGPWAGIVTTNYDRLIESALDQVGRKFERCEADLNRLGIILAQPSDTAFFVKLHGSISSERPVLTTEDYNRKYLKSPNLTAFLTAMMLRYHVVFVGCSLTDEVVNLRRTLALQFDNLIPKAYGLLPETESNRDHKNWLADIAQIHVTLYDAADSEHEAVDRFLREIAECAPCRN